MKKDVIRLIGIAGVLINVFALAASYYFRTQSEEHAKQVEEQTKIDSSVFVRPHSHSIGPVDAKVTIVEFLDPECESCREIYPLVKHLLSQYQSNVRWVVRYMPLHPNSLFAAGALEAAGEQGKYWEMLEVLFANQPDWGSHHAPKPELIPGYAKKIGLDMKKFDRFLKIGAHKELVQIDHSDGTKLGVRGTPTFFVNGKLLEELGYESLKTLIDQELAKD